MDHHSCSAALFARNEFTVMAWRDPVVEAHGWPADDWRTLWFLAPILGPSGTLMLHRLGGFAAEIETRWRPEEFAASFGMRGTGRQSPVVRTVARLCKFDYARISASALAVRTHVGPLAQRHIQTLPDALATAYRQHVTSA